MGGASADKGRFVIPQGSPTGYTGSRALAIYQYRKTNQRNGRFPPGMFERGAPKGAWGLGVLP